MVMAPERMPPSTIPNNEASQSIATADQKAYAPAAPPTIAVVPVATQCRLHFPLQGDGVVDAMVAAMGVINAATRSATVVAVSCLSESVSSFVLLFEEDFDESWLSSPAGSVFFSDLFTTGIAVPPADCYH